MNKRGQVTVFMIIGILVVAGVVLFFLLGGDANDDNQVPSEAEEINDFVKGCLEEAVIDSIYLNSLRGGYYDVPNNSIDLETFSIPMYFDEGVSNLPSKKTLEEELSKSIESEIQNCLNFETFEEKGYNFSIPEDPKIETEIREGRVSANMDYLIDIKKGEFTTQIDSFEETANFDYLEKYNTVREFIDLQKTDPEYVFVTQLEEMGNERGFNSEMMGAENSSYIFYNFEYPEEINNGQEYTYSFVVRY